MKNIMRDVKTAAGLFVEIRKARKNGDEVGIRHSRQLPCINSGPAFFDTVEGCHLANGDASVFEEIWKIFSEFTSEEKRMICLEPKNGELISRVNFWKAKLKPVMSDRYYRIAIGSILQWYIHIKKMHLDANDKNSCGVVS